jgi:two-component system CheB/CheR fusion protein
MKKKDSASGHRVKVALARVKMSNPVPAAVGSVASTSAALRPLTIVAVGASAGGLEALTLFLKPIPKETSFAFVIVQHLDPTVKGMLPELLQRASALPVVPATDAMRIEGGRVYVMPSNTALTITDNALHLATPDEPRGMRLPIDLLFRSLADNSGGKSIAVVLSGMGADGTLGAQHIREIGGAVFVQDPPSAKYDSMPRSVIDAGFSTDVAPAEMLYSLIEAHALKGASGPDDSGTDDPQALVVALTTVAADLDPEQQPMLDEIIRILREQAGHDFSNYKATTLSRRIERRIAVHHLTTLAEYAKFLVENPAEGDLLFNELLIGVTSFFRDAAVWEQLSAEVIPALLAAHPEGGTLRAWVAGCSTGEEAYSLAIIFKEVLQREKPKAAYSIQVFATDLDKHAIDRARAGRYPATIAADVSEERLARFFVKDDGFYRVSKEIRELLVFAPQNMVMDPPFSKLDILTCRNLLIYLTAALQRKLLPFFHYALNPGGILVLGTAETVGSATNLFSALSGKTRIYRRLDSPIELDHLGFSSPLLRAGAEVSAGTGDKKMSAALNLQTMSDRVLLQHFAPAAVLVTDQGDILNVTGKTGRFLEPAAGKANWNLFAMARDGLSHAIHEGFRRAVRTKETVTIDTKIDGTPPLFVRVAMQPLTESENMRGMVLVVFAELPDNSPEKRIGKGSRSKTALGPAALTAELQIAREELQASHADMLTSQQELTAAIRDMQSTNEELQSTNEELTTSKEEVQSMNEELQTVNHELQAKLDELALASSDMNNLLNSTSIATLFLDRNLLVRRFTTQTAKVINLIPGDVGRPITDIASALNFSEMADDVHSVLRTLATREREVVARDGRWFDVRIMPYRTQDDRIDGVVLTFNDVSKAKALEAALRQAQVALEGRIATQETELDQAHAEATEHAQQDAKPAR